VPFIAVGHSEEMLAEMQAIKKNVTVFTNVYLGQGGEKDCDYQKVVIDKVLNGYACCITNIGVSLEMLLAIKRALKPKGKIFFDRQLPREDSQHSP